MFCLECHKITGLSLFFFLCWLFNLSWSKTTEQIHRNPCGTCWKSDERTLQRTSPARRQQSSRCPLLLLEMPSFTSFLLCVMGEDGGEGGRWVNFSPLFSKHLYETTHNARNDPLCFQLFLFLNRVFTSFSCKLFRAYVVHLRSGEHSPFLSLKIYVVFNRWYSPFLSPFFGVYLIIKPKSLQVMVAWKVVKTSMYLYDFFMYEMLLLR